ncbi:gamma-glutamyltransferase [Helicocarpus griseus UAMH5409]|uniref:Glutathione hydrolase n=1 Tax=Helicocarpus griseus UAMH5409 TaxID=1447875 RepID=A0A2B7X4X2_9EURO|nr:gamma-glutamyltransferase [Helicocarpus griseus UAMH5409]
MLFGTLYLFSSIATFTGVVGLRNGGVGKGDSSGDGNGGSLGAVASENGYCSEIGGGMLKAGGNAADAMVATVLCVGVTAMYHSGIGGGGFAVVRTPDDKYEFVDFREMAPAAAFEDMFKDNPQASITGGLASGVPGELRGLEYLHKKYGSLPWSTVMEPSIRTARDGWTVSEDLVDYMDSATDGEEDFLVTDPTWAIDFAPNGTRLGLGDTITRKRYAETLQKIADEGADAFYSGQIAETMTKALQAANGIMTVEDLKNYSVAIRDISQVDYRGYKVTSGSAPSSGAVAMSILNILDEYDDFFTLETTNLSTHRLAEAMRFAYGQRTNLGDPYFVEGLEKYEDDMLSAATAAEIRGKISDLHTLNVSEYNPGGIESLETPGTAHIVSTDHTGLAVSLTTTVNLLFGSKLMVPETGIIMNDEMNDFSIPDTDNEFGYIPSPSNYIRPGKRMLSSMCPTIVTHANGTLHFITGAAGGSRIITSTVQSVINVVDRGMGAAQALDERRLHDQLVPDVSTFEKEFDAGVVEFMEGRKHNVSWVNPGQSAVQAIRVLAGGGFEAAGEPRQKNAGGVVV